MIVVGSEFAPLVTEALVISWTILAVALVCGLIYSVWRIIPRKEE
jgi:hypothetical protein